MYDEGSFTLDLQQKGLSCGRELGVVCDESLFTVTLEEPLKRRVKTVVLNEESSAMKAHWR